MCLPDLFLFNPTCDFAVANGSPNWQPNAVLMRMEEDMASIVRFLATPKDIILLIRLPSPELCLLLKSAGFPDPRFITFDSFLNNPEQVRDIHPWGWSPAFIRFIKPVINSGNCISKNPGIALWKKSDKELRSRDTARMVLLNILQNHFHENFLPLTLAPQVCQTLEEIESYALKHGPLMMKSPWSSSGRGLIPITEIPFHKSIKQQLASALKSQGFVMAEPLLEKVHDLAFLYDSNRGIIKFSGISRFFTNTKGQYEGNYLGDFPADITHPERNFLEWAILHLPKLHIKVLTETGLINSYSGPLGIDTLIFRDEAGNLKINPCLEINWRYTMGHISLELENYIHSSSRGIFRIWQGKEKSFSQMVRAKEPHFKTCHESGKIISGFIPLTEFACDNQFGAYMEASPK